MEIQELLTVNWSSLWDRVAEKTVLSTNYSLIMVIYHFSISYNNDRFLLPNKGKENTIETIPS